MHRIIYMDPNLLEGLELKMRPDPDPEIDFEVNQAMERIDPALRDLLKARYYDGKTLSELAAEFGIDDKNVRRLLYKAVREMKIQLADFVRRRWGIENAHVCWVCVHPERDKIEAILREKSESNSWRHITERIFEAAGRRFPPPQVLKAHMAHMESWKGGRDE